MRIRSAFLLALTFSTGVSRFLAGAEPVQVLDLWPGVVPDEPVPLGPERERMSPALDRTQVEVTEPTRMLTDVSRPTITIRRPAKERDSGASVLICPGGGYWNLYWQLEGEEVADWLNSLGMTGIILKYRVPRRLDEPEKEPARRPLQDAQRAVSLVRSHAGEWGLDPKKIGMVGFSAGGHLAIATATSFEKRTYPPIDAVDQVSCRPDFAILVYPGYLRAKDKSELAPGLHVPDGTPPIFLAHGGDDLISSPEHSVLMYLALKQAGIAAELHVYAGARHDFGVRPSDQPCSTWTVACAQWLRQQGVIQGGPKTSAAPGQEGKLGLFDGHSDVGQPKLAGSAGYNPISQEYALSASGVNMWAQRDEFHFLWKKMKGDFLLQARVELEGKGVDPHRKLGWIVRSTLDADAPYADAALHGDGLTSLQYRRARGATTEEVKSAVKGPDFLQLERRGKSFILSVARFGDPLASSRLEELDLGDEVYAGLFLCAHNAGVLERGIFRDVRVIRPAKEGFVPYRDYIGSLLEVLEPESGRRKVIHRSSEPFEAPNWTRDGGAIIYNTSGRSPGRGHLRRFDLATRRESTIDTGPAARINNDHVLSFDGARIGISDQSADGGKSAIYTLPLEGGTPHRITPLVPSYLHGWSPDGKELLYTAERNGDFDIYRIAADGSGPETRLTNAKGLDDGPEYSPDGQYIYFNSVRSGAMQIWRMRSDGSDPSQITSDGYQDWFPHVSPDGRWIVFISFERSVDPSDHPYYRQVYLQRMPVAGGPPQIVAYVYGGQGTLNVPSWSPDSKLAAFVSNSDDDAGVSSK